MFSTQKTKIDTPTLEFQDCFCPQIQLLIANPNRVVFPIPMSSFKRQAAKHLKKAPFCEGPRLMPGN